MLVKFKRISTIKSHGDTMVEVMIAVLLVSMVLTGAYVTTNRSALGIRDSQEHAQALKLAQGQLEQVRQNAAQSNPAAFNQTAGNSFCMVNASVATGPACIRTDADQPAGAGDLAYTLAVRRGSCSPQYNPPSAAGQCHKFTIRVTWDSVVTKGQTFEQIITRMYER